MDVVNVILQPVIESLLVPVKKHIGFMVSCKKYVRDMGTSMKELNATRIDVENHTNENRGNKLEIPAHVTGWLEEAEKVDTESNTISSNVGSCFSFKTRHDIGVKAFNLIQDIKRLTEEHSRIVWTNHPIPLGKVDSMKASTSAPSVEYHSDFESREETFMKALKALEPDHKSHMIALCGMGGVGKTTMMQKLKTVVKEKKMFSLIVEAVIGEKTNPFAIQDAVADYLSIDLKEKTISARADKLRTWFRNYSEGGKKNILVILDDIWQLVDLNDIGLSPFSDQGVDFKVLLTSRSRDVCIRMDVEANSIFDVKVLAEEEAQRFFWKFIKDSDEADLDPDLRKVGDDIVRRCQGLPIALKTIAKTLLGKSKSVWDDTITRLQHFDIHEIVNEVFELSYKNLEDEQTKSVLLLCGLYQEDFDIPTEELVRYGWGLKLFKDVYTIRQARNRLNTCIEQLFNANLLIESNRGGCIKLHDLVLAFVLKMCSRGEHVSIVNHGNMTEWPANDTPDSCRRISLACDGLEEFPRDFKYPNLSFLKLTHGDESLRFPENFYGLMEKLQVIVYEEMQSPLLPRLFEYSTNLRTLCLHGCELISDFHSIGSLLNLEVLSFADCSIQTLPSTIGNLKKLKVLDLTGCVNLHIDDGVFKNLVKLEELYMGIVFGEGISFTDGGFNELAVCSEKLTAIEIELVGNNDRPKRMSFNNLERFKISIGCTLEKEDAFENTLMLVSNKDELLESRINVLFEKTVVLHLKVDGMNDLADLKYSSFNNLRVLKISKCAQLKYLFTRRVVATLLKLEHLEVLLCDIMQTLIHDEDSGSGPIKFPILNFLSLSGLPKLAGLCNTGCLIELPQLMELRLNGLPNLTSIFPDDNLASSSMTSVSLTTPQSLPNTVIILPDLRNLRTLAIFNCHLLRYVFPFLTLQSLTKLEFLSIRLCEGIRVIVKEEDGNRRTTTSDDDEVMVFPCLKTMELKYLDNLESFFLGMNDFRLPVLNEVRIEKCPKMTTFTQGCLDSPMLKYLTSDMGENSVECGLNNLFHPTAALKQQFQVPYPSLDGSASLPISERMPWFYNYLIKVDVSLRWDQRYIIRHNELQHMQKIGNLKIICCSAKRGVFETFEMNNGLNPTHCVVEVREMDFCDLNDLKCLWTSKQWTVLKFPNLTKLSIDKCFSLKHVFTISMVGCLLQLQELHISVCPKMEKILEDVEKEEEDNDSDEEEEDSDADEEEEVEDEVEDDNDEKVEENVDERRVKEDDREEEEEDDNDENEEKNVDERRVKEGDEEENEEDDNERRVKKRLSFLVLDR